LCTPLWVYARFRPYGDVTALLLKRRVPTPISPTDGMLHATVIGWRQRGRDARTRAGAEWGRHVPCNSVEGSCPLLWAGSIGGFFRSTSSTDLCSSKREQRENSSESGEYGHALGCSLLEPTLNKYSHRLGLYLGCTRKPLGRWLPRTTFPAEYSSELLCAS
jgi:hypothetical protein